MLWIYKSGHITALELVQWPVWPGWYTRPLHLSDLISVCSPPHYSTQPHRLFQGSLNLLGLLHLRASAQNACPLIAPRLASQCFSVTFPVKPPLGTPLKTWNSPHSWYSHHLSWLHVSSLLSLSYIGRNFCLFFNLFNAVPPVFKTVPST